MEENKDIQPIDIIGIVKKLWARRSLYFRILPAVLIGTYLFTLFIPRYYKCTVSLAPETNSGLSGGGSLQSLASSFGLGASLAKMNSSDALYAEIYPDVVASRDFIAELMPIQVQNKDGDIKCNYYIYLRDKQKTTWWSYLMYQIKDMIVPTPKDTQTGDEKISVFNHTKQQEDIFKAIQGNIQCKYDKKTDIVSITVKDQDPLICATMAQETCRTLQEFITDYRTNKARKDYEYYKKLCDESKADYEKALETYARSADAHGGNVLALYQTKLESLENDMQAKYNIYTAMNQQLQAAAAKVQEDTPAFTIIDSASVPHRPAGPKRMILSILMTMLAFIVLTGKVLMKKEA